MFIFSIKNKISYFNIYKNMKIYMKISFYKVFIMFNNFSIYKTCKITILYNKNNLVDCLLNNKYLKHYKINK
jgi:hypothetical protein